MKIILPSSGPLQAGPTADAALPAPLPVRRITGMAAAPVPEQDRPSAGDAPPSGDGDAAVAAPARRRCALRPGDLVRVVATALASRWHGAGRDGLVRVRAVDPGRGRRCIAVHPADASARSLRYEWLAEDDLEPADGEAPADLRSWMPGVPPPAAGTG